MKRRQSIDFGEIWNVQTDMKVTDEHWDRIFHNWNDPLNCSGRYRAKQCTICALLDKYGYVEYKNASYKYNIAIIGDIHANYENVLNFMQRKDLLAIFSVGDLALFSSMDAIKQDKAALKYAEERNKIFINSDIKFPIPLYLISGNHDDYANLYTTWFTDRNIHYLKNNEKIKINAITITGLNGILAGEQMTWPAHLKDTVLRKFYSKDDLKNFDMQCDILLTHQAPKYTMPEEGVEDLNYLIDKQNRVQKLKWFHGHHHVNYVNLLKEDVNIYGLGNFSLDPSSFSIINTLNGEIIK